MSFLKRGPEKHGTSWEELADGLVASIAGLAPGSSVMLERPATDPESSPEFLTAVLHVRVEDDDGDQIIVLAPSNHTRAEDNRLPASTLARLVDLGWQAPPAVLDEDDSPYYRKNWSWTGSERQASELVVRTLREAFAATSPTQITYRATWADGGLLELPDLGLSRTPRPADPIRDAIYAELREMFEGELQVLPNGDVPLGFGSAGVQLRVVDDDPPTVRATAPLLLDVTSPAHEVTPILNNLNLRVPFIKVVFDDGVILAISEFPAELIDAPTVVGFCNRLGGFADDIDDALQAELGGRRFLANDPPPTTHVGTDSTPGSSGYL